MQNYFSAIFFLILSLGCTPLYAWDTSLKTEIYRTSTSNVNSSNSAIESDTYNTIAGTLQTKNDFHKFKLKIKSEKYQKTNSNDNYFVDLGYTYKESKARDYSFDIFKQKYINTPTISTDTTSDNIGAKLGTTYSKSFSKDRNGYISLLGTYKNYVNIPTRKDTIADATFGLENYLTDSFSMTPEINLEYNYSKDNYYSNFNIGPALYLNFTISEDLELFANAYLTYTNYRSRTFQTTVNNRTIQNKEHQTLVITEVGALYTLFEKIILQGKYTTNKNSSNNPTSGYSTRLFTFNIGYKF